MPQIPNKKNNTIKKEDKDTLAPAIILLNILILGVLVLLGFFIYNYVTTEEPMQQNRTAMPPPLTSTLPTMPPLSAIEPDEVNQPTINNDPAVNPPEISMTKAETTPPPFEAAAWTPRAGEYTKDFFSNSLFIGDSIMTGIHLYGHIPANNVFAKIGMGIGSAASAEIDGETSLNKAKEMLPERVYIMLGSNEIGYGKPNDMIINMESFIKSIQSAVPDSELILLTIPPVTSAHERDNNENMESINDFNSKLKAFAAQNNLRLIDVCSILKDSTGYFSANYAENDGLHFKSEAYKIMLSYIQTTILSN